MEPMKVVPLNISAPPPGLERYGGYSTPPSAESSPPGLRLPREVRQEATSFRAPPGLEGEQVLAPTLLARRRPAMPPGNWRHGASRDMARTEGAVCKAVVREPQEAPKPEATPAGQLLEQGWRETMESDIAAMVVLALPQVRSLSYHALGHYVVVRLLELGSREQRTAITQQLLGSVHLLCKDRFGCRVLQKAVEMVPSDMQLQLAGEIKSRVIDCVEDSYGNFVVQKFVESLPQSAWTSSLRRWSPKPTAWSPTSMAAV